MGSMRKTAQSKDFGEIRNTHTSLNVSDLQWAKAFHNWKEPWNCNQNKRIEGCAICNMIKQEGKDLKGNKFLINIILNCLNNKYIDKNLSNKFKHQFIICNKINLNNKNTNIVIININDDYIKINVDTLSILFLNNNKIIKNVDNMQQVNIIVDSRKTLNKDEINNFLVANPNIIYYIHDHNSYYVDRINDKQTIIGTDTNVVLNTVTKQIMG